MPTKKPPFKVPPKAAVPVKGKPPVSAEKLPEPKSVDLKESMARRLGK